MLIVPSDTVRSNPVNQLGPKAGLAEDTAGASVMIAIDQARSLVYNAACAFDTEPARARAYAHMAKSAASDLAGFAAGRSVQYHGGIGFTWECFVHLYFKRQQHSRRLWGDGAWHRARLADLWLGAA